MLSSPALTATQALHKIDQGFAIQSLLQDCLAQISAREPVVKAWQCLNSAAAQQKAERLDCQENYRGVLGGIPVSVKDIIATADLPTEWGTPIYRDRNLGYDAAVVERLRQAGAIILGKTTTTEYASGQPTQTTNPHNPNHTPGASSSGSAAAVAAGMVPLAIGTQSVGSVLRPAAYCGVLGFKPSFGTISRFGVMPVSREIDQVGCFARSVDDLALLCSVLMGSDRRDPDCWTQPFSFEVQRLIQPPTIGLLRGPFWAQVENEGQAALMGQAESLAAAGAELTEVALSADFTAYFSHIETLMMSGLAVNHGKDLAQHPDQVSPKLRGLIEQARSLPPLAYGRARQAVVHYHRYLNSLFGRVDAILTPVTTGPAPIGLENTGSPLFCALWTLCGLPAISIPAGTAANGLPLAVQLVAPPRADARLLGIADWLIQSSKFAMN
ncbi:amidase [Romeria aff. gracilis LEGE 07310]|uniref:Amidase n=1 Tax=Vasconcelosia minhoensis LEGE 07310 TaxID=915328 RepID=A0A8J7DP12_9CYAN|nr:amidase [Romeria gracilis]MBE9078920.1 amidase [Romeria aff. gracilis LEGE 07310]